MKNVSVMMISSRGITCSSRLITKLSIQRLQSRDPPHLERLHRHVAGGPGEQEAPQHLECRRERPLGGAGEAEPDAAQQHGGPGPERHAQHRAQHAPALERPHAPAHGARRLVPMVRARLTAINDEDLVTRRFQGEGGWLRREANLTWAEELDATNRIVEGAWWSPDTERAEISLEQEIAQGMGLKLGDRMTFDVAGTPLTAEITSLRTVEWDSLSPNFFMVLNPAALAAYPATFIGSVYAPERQVMLEVSRRFPSVTVIDLESVLDQVRSVMDRAALGIQYVFVFTLLAGVVASAGTVHCLTLEQIREAIREVGFTPRQRNVFYQLIDEPTAVTASVA